MAKMSMKAVQQVMTATELLAREFKLKGVSLTSSGLHVEFDDGLQATILPRQLIDELGAVPVEAKLDGCGNVAMDLASKSRAIDPNFVRRIVDEQYRWASNWYASNFLVVVSDAVRAARRVKGLSQRTVAAAAGLSVDELASIENGAFTPTRQISQLIEPLSLNLKDIFDLQQTITGRMPQYDVLEGDPEDLPGLPGRPHGG
jgi:DNA-binding XRE family transcriptional regulator